MTDRTHSTTDVSAPDQSPITLRSKLRRSSERFLARLPPEVLHLAVVVAFLALAIGPAAAQGDGGGSSDAASTVGDVYCGTGVDTGINIVFGAVAGLGLPATGYYLSKGGLAYMRAGGNPEKKNDAKERIVMSGVGFGIIVVALISPELVDKIGSQMGFGFSDCVKPF